MLNDIEALPYISLSMCESADGGPKLMAQAAAEASISMWAAYVTTGEKSARRSCVRGGMRQARTRRRAGDRDWGSSDALLQQKTRVRCAERSAARPARTADDRTPSVSPWHLELFSPRAFRPGTWSFSPWHREIQARLCASSPRAGQKLSVGARKRARGLSRRTKATDPTRPRDRQEPAPCTCASKNAWGCV